MPKRRSPQSPLTQENAALDGEDALLHEDRAKRRRVAPQTRAQALAQLNRLLVKLLSDQLRTQPSGNWTKLLAQYDSRVQEIYAAFAVDTAATPEADAVWDELSLPSFANGASDKEKTNQDDDDVVPASPATSPRSSRTAEASAEEADNDDNQATTASTVSTAEAAASVILDDLPASPNPFAGGFSHSLPLDEDDEDNGDRFSAQQVQFVTTREAEDAFMAQTSLSFGMDCFLPVNRSVGIWNEPVLLQRRIPSHQLTVHKQHASGDFGDVFLGELCGQRVAIKRLCPSEQNKANALTFASEIAVMSELSHPKIATFVGVEWAREWEAQAVAEFVPHGDLRSLLDSPAAASLSWAEFKCKVVLDVLDALAYLHQRSPSVVMEVVKARNVLISDADGSAKLSVFASARVRSVTDSNSGSVECSRWLAPEIILAEPKTHRSTIYSFGVLLCELDTTRVPYWNATDPDGSPMSSYKIAQLVTSGKLQPSLSEECPAPIAALVRQCLVLDPAQRPTAASIGYKLLEILKNDL